MNLKTQLWLKGKIYHLGHPSADEFNTMLMGADIAIRNLHELPEVRAKLEDFGFWLEEFLRDHTAPMDECVKLFLTQQKPKQDGE